MNFKQKIWILSCFVSISLWISAVVFSCEDGPRFSVEHTTDVEVLQDGCDSIKQDFRLSKSVAINRVGRYQTYISTSLPPAPVHPKANDIVNPDVRYFHLPRCELDKMLEEVGPEGDVKAHLAIRTDTLDNLEVQQIVLVFGDFTDESTKWYDFVNPCPSNCTK